jgi:hypothetical protein
MTTPIVRELYPHNATHGVRVAPTTLPRDIPCGYCMHCGYGSAPYSGEGSSECLHKRSSQRALVAASLRCCPADPTPTKG